MPCQSWEDRLHTVYADSSELQELKLLRAAMCGVYKNYRKTGIDPFSHVDWKEQGISRQEIDSWWKHHQKEDKKKGRK